MKLRLQQLLLKLGHLSKSEAATRHTLSKATGIDLDTMTRIFAKPQSRLSFSETDKIIAYLFDQFRTLITNEVSDEQLWNQICYELIDFEQVQQKDQECKCSYNPDGKYSLKDIMS